jgi:hypothetical protein
MHDSPSIMMLCTCDTARFKLLSCNSGSSTAAAAAVAAITELCCNTSTLCTCEGPLRHVTHTHTHRVFSYNVQGGALCPLRMLGCCLAL